MTPAQRRRPFTVDGFCNVCRAWVGSNPKDRQTHIERHLRALQASGLLRRDTTDAPHMTEKTR